MNWEIGRDDHAAFEAARDLLLDRFFAAGHEDRAVSNASLLLDWKFSYSDGDLVTWTTAHLDEMILEWAPRKVSMPATLARPMIVSFQQFFAFLAQEHLLGLGSSSWRAIDAHLAALARPFEQAMGDSSQFGMAKSMLSAVGGLSGDVPDEKSLRAMMESFNELSYEERSRALGLPARPRDPWLELTDGFDMLPAVPVSDEAVAAFIANTPFFAGIETIREFVGGGRKLTAKGNLNIADTKSLAWLLFPELLGGLTSPFEVRSADDIPAQQFMLRFARLAGAVKVTKGTLSATASWSKKNPVECTVRAVFDVLDRGPVQLSLGDGQWTNQAADALIDAGVPHLLAILWAVEELPVEDLVDDVVEIARMTIPRPGRSLPDTQRIVVNASFDRLLRVLGSFGLVVQYAMTEGHDDDVPGESEPLILTDTKEGGMLALTEFGRAVLPSYLRKHGYNIPAAGKYVGRPLQELFEHVDEWRPDRLAIEFDLWAAAVPADVAIEQLADVADSADPQWRLHAAELAQRLPAEFVEPALHRLLDTRSRGQAILALREHGAEDFPDDFAAQLLAGVDLLAQLLDPDDTELFVRMISNIDDLEGFIDQVWRIGEPHAGDLLAAIGRSHPDKRLAKVARTAVVRHRSLVANFRQS